MWEFYFFGKRFRGKRFGGELLVLEGGFIGED